MRFRAALLDGAEVVDIPAGSSPPFFHGNEEKMGKWTQNK